MILTPVIQDVAPDIRLAVGEVYSPMGSPPLRIPTHSGQALPTNIEQVTVENSIHTMQQMLAQIKDSQDRLEQRLDGFMLKMEVRREEHIQTSPMTGKDNQPAASAAETSHPVITQLGVKGNLADHMAETKQLQLPADEERSAWTHFQEALKGQSKHSRLYKELQQLESKDASIWHHIFGYFGLASCLATEPPDTSLAKAVEHSYFSLASGTLVLANTCLMGYETDASIKVALQQPGAREVEWMPTCNLVFNLVFVLEMLIKIFALRSWYMVSPDDWMWNMFDFFLVVFSLVNDFLQGLNLSFMRSLRILRAVRAARIIRVLRVFRELRKMLLAILASIKPLLWAFVFLAMLTFMISILLLQGLTTALEDMNQNSAEYLSAKSQVLPWYGSMGDTMFSLVRAITGGAEWYNVYEPLEIANTLYGIIFVFFVLFVLIGVMNVLTGVFLGSAADTKDRDLLIQDYRVQVESFVSMMMDLFSEIDLSKTGDITFETFRKAMENDSVQATLTANGLEPLHANLIFDLMDEHNSGRINLFDFVMGMMHLKGHATSVDARVILKEIGMFPKIVGKHVGQLKAHMSSLSNTTPG